MAPQRRATREPRPPSTTRRRPGFSVEVREELNHAILSKAMVVVSAFAGYELPLLESREHTSFATFLARPLVGIGLRQSLPMPIGVPRGTTEFLLSAATLRACPLRLRFLHERAVLRACLEGTLGVLQFESRGIPLAQKTGTRWLDGSVSVVGSFSLAGPWFATASMTLVAPTTRHRFEVVELGSPAAALRRQLVSQAPPLSLAAGIGLGLRF